MARIYGMEPQIPPAIEAEIASVDDWDGHLFAVWFGDLLVVDWDVEMAPSGLEVTTGIVLSRGVIHEVDLMVEVARTQGVHAIEESSSGLHSDLFFRKHPSMDLI